MQCTGEVPDKALPHLQEIHQGGRAGLQSVACQVTATADDVVPRTIMNTQLRFSNCHSCSCLPCHCLSLDTHKCICTWSRLCAPSPVLPCRSDLLYGPCVSFGIIWLLSMFVNLYAAFSLKALTCHLKQHQLERGGTDCCPIMFGMQLCLLYKAPRPKEPFEHMFLWPSRIVQHPACLIGLYTGRLL